ncbi:hypothetical protein KP001_06190 [Geomonas subterranea]|uniref:Lipoprotein n=1 Tax=Geomonas subterranea TaxID=2847989 RepID=A0ABX8LRG9_9BACT|nr:hypothetical protein [Geomonas subterranea]QXE92115.1 hypothetical protein KP001_06190 [Geomonas subterranea]QXM09789.1 hypothetical protein KP002_01305 [Geomonas subterranea]
MKRLLHFVLLCLCVIPVVACSTIHATPYSATNTENTSLEVGKNYRLDRGTEKVLMHNSKYIVLIKAEQLYKPDVDTVFKSLYHPVKQGSKFQIVALTDEGNYVGWPLDGYRPKQIKQSDSPGFMSSLIGSAAQYAGERALNSAITGTSKGQSFSTGGGVGSGLSPEMAKKVNNAAIDTAGGVGTGLVGGGILGKVVTVGAKGNALMSSAEKVMNDTPSLNSNGILKQGGSSMLPSTALISSVYQSYNIQDTIFFFEKSTLKPYALRSYVDRTEMDQMKDHIFYKILNNEGDFKLERGYLNLKKSSLWYTGAAGAVVSFLFKNYDGDAEKPVYVEAIEVDLNKTSTVEVAGFKFKITSAGGDAAEIKLMAAPI